MQTFQLLNPVHYLGRNYRYNLTGELHALIEQL